MGLLTRRCGSRSKAPAHASGADAALSSEFHWVARHTWSTSATGDPEDRIEQGSTSRGTLSGSVDRCCRRAESTHGPLSRQGLRTHRGADRPTDRASPRLVTRDRARAGCTSGQIPALRIRPRAQYDGRRSPTTYRLFTLRRMERRIRYWARASLGHCRRPQSLGSRDRR